MENLPFVIWLIGYPLASSITRYLAQKTKRLNKEEPYSYNVLLAGSIIDLIIWIVIANIL